VNPLQADSYYLLAVLTFKILHSNHTIYLCTLYDPCGPGSSVGIVTDYGLDGPGSNTGGGEILRPFRPAVGPTQPPAK